MQRYFVNEARLDLGQSIQLSEDDSHHLMKVMRAQEGDLVEVVSQVGQVYLAELEAGSRPGQVKIIQIQRTQEVEMPCQVSIAAGLSKNDKLDWIVQKGTELGMVNFIPISLKRNVVQWDQKKAPQKVERLQKIALSASQQSKRLIVPQVQPLHNLQELIQVSSDFDYKWLAYEEEAKEGDHQTLKLELQKVQAKQKILAVFGSEGGLDPQEVQTLVEAGFVPISLGPRILRAETAPAYLLSAMSYQMEL